jgi:hypothetical protein
MRVVCKNKKCGKTFFKQPCEIKKSKNHYCCRSCFISCNNKSRQIKKTTKIITCETCKKQLNVSKFSASKICMACRSKRKCYCCGAEIIVKKKSNKKYCNKCRVEIIKNKAKENGKKSAQSQKRRSKNEIYFSELCAKKFNILTNELYFNSKTGKWDADIIIPEIKTAILWNGSWHYKKIVKKQSLKQIQTRDKIKYKVIKSNGYEIYVLKDMGKFDKKFVESEF